MTQSTRDLSADELYATQDVLEDLCSGIAGLSAEATSAGEPTIARTLDALHRRTFARLDTIGWAILEIDSRE